MEEQQQHEMEQVAQNFGEALIASYRMCSRGDLPPQQADPELTGWFCNLVLSYLDAQAGHVFAASQERLEQIRGTQEPTELPEQEPVESVGAYMGFLNSMFAYYMRTDSELPG